MDYFISTAIIHAFIVLFLSCMGQTGKFVHVAEFPVRKTSFSEINDAIDPETALSTKEISGCFRFMLRYSRGYHLIRHGQITVAFKTVKLNIGFITINSWNNMSANSTDDAWMEGYSRSFRFCRTYVPGKWISLCFSTKFTNGRQDLKVVQDGAVCFQGTYEAEVDGIYINTKNKSRGL